MGENGLPIASPLRKGKSAEQFNFLEFAARQHLLQSEKTEKTDLAGAVRNDRRLVLLGDPGAGKTTLAKFLVLQFARALKDKRANVTDAAGNEYGIVRLPILIRVSEYAEARRLDVHLTLRDFLTQAFDLGPATRQDMKKVFDRALNDGSAFILLDGMDEVASLAARLEIAQQIEAFAASIPPENRLLVTSRIAGYREASLSNTFQKYNLRDMDDEQISQFVHQWCMATERFQTPDAAETDVCQRAERESKALLASIASSEGVRRLATNPLLLTILALIHRNGAHLPQHRVKLYELATQTLLSDWRLANAGGEARTVKAWEAEEMLGPLAYHMHKYEPTGLIADAKARELLYQYHAAARGRKFYDADIVEEVDDFLCRVREHSGLLVERAPGKYGFMHLTFEEYFAGRELISDFTQAAQKIYDVRHLPRWEEPVRLAIASERPKNADYLIRTAILAQKEKGKRSPYQPSPYEKILHRDLLFAARCLSDCESADSILSEEIGNQLADTLFEGNDNERSLFGIRLHIEPILPELTGSLMEATLINRALNDLKARGNKGYSYVSDILCKIANSTPEVVSALREIIKGDSKYLCYSAAAKLVELGIKDKAVIDTLIFSLNYLPILFEMINSADPYLDLHVTQVLVSIGRDNIDVINSVREHFELAQPPVQRYLAVALGQLGDNSPEVVKILATSTGEPSRLFIDGAWEALWEATTPRA